MSSLLFSGLRASYLIYTAQFSKIKWCVKNHSYHMVDPLFWKKDPNYKDLSLNFDFLSEYASLTNTKEQFLEKHFVKLMKTRGTCHGQCLAMVEEICLNPNASPNEILNKIKEQPTRVMFFQMLEIIRPQSLALEEKCLELFPPCHSKKRIDFPQIDEIREIMTRDQDDIFIIRYWNERTSVTHSVIYIKMNHQYWFYNCSWAGAYSYPNAEKLFKQFVKHMKDFFPNSYHNNTHLLIETYKLNSTESNRG